MKPPSNKDIIRNNSYELLSQNLDEPNIFPLEYS
jgi:hypothetical protein